MKFYKKTIIIVLLLSSLQLLGSIYSQIAYAQNNNSFSFTITSDIRYHTNLGEYPAMLDAITTAGGPGDFMLVVGDFEPPNKVDICLKEEFGSDFIWYPVVGNHELDSASYIDWIYNNFHNLPHIVNLGPENCENTTYSFDYYNAHFVILNQYYDGKSDKATDGDVTPLLLTWLEGDLNGTDKDWIFVIGHEPAYPQPDQNWGDMRHFGDSLDKYPENRDQFWQLLDFFNVTAYICGHTHRYSSSLKDGVWQIDTGQARGTSRYDTFLKVKIDNNQTTLTAYRSLNGTFSITETIHINQENITSAPSSTPSSTPTSKPLATPTPLLSPSTAPIPTASPVPTPNTTPFPEFPLEIFGIAMALIILGVIVIFLILYKK